MKIQRSEFIGLALPVRTEEEFDVLLANVQKRFFDATHHCWAFRLFSPSAPLERSSDAGEPAGTAGKPIASAISSAALVDTAVVVVRYYGGVKLGTGGLVRAYREAAVAALEIAPKLTRYLLRRVVVTVPFSRLNHVYRLIAPPDVRLEREEFGPENSFHFLVRESLVDRFASGLTEARLQFQLGATEIV